MISIFCSIYSDFIFVFILIPVVIYWFVYLLGWVVFIDLNINRSLSYWYFALSTSPECIIARTRPLMDKGLMLVVAPEQMDVSFCSWSQTVCSDAAVLWAVGHDNILMTNNFVSQIISQKFSWLLNYCGDLADEMSKSCESVADQDWLLLFNQQSKTQRLLIHDPKW